MISHPKVVIEILLNSFKVTNKNRELFLTYRIQIILINKRLNAQTLVSLLRKISVCCNLTLSTIFYFTRCNTITKKSSMTLLF